MNECVFTVDGLAVHLKVPLDVASSLLYALGAMGVARRVGFAKTKRGRPKTQWALPQELRLTFSGDTVNAAH